MITKSSLRILIVEDDIDTAESTAMLLRLAGHEVTTAYIFPTAMMAAQDYKPNVLLMDLMLPNVDGYEVAKQIVRILAEKPLMIAVTGCTVEQHRQKAMAAGFDHFLVKPVEPGVLENILHEYAMSPLLVET